MGILNEVKSSKRSIYRRTLLYGPHGVGKTTWASQWAKPLFICTEDGQAHIDVPCLPFCSSYLEFNRYLTELGNPGLPNDYSTLVIDSIDWLEKLVWQDICRRACVEFISEVPYGKGYSEASAIFDSIYNNLEVIRKNKMHIVLIAHCKIEKFDSPNGDSYDRYSPKLHKSCNGTIQEWCDEVLFVNYATFTRKVDKGAHERSIGIAGDRTIYTAELPAYNAKSRLSLPPELSVDFDEYREYLTGRRTFTEG